jgi:hypothetical protein
VTPEVLQELLKDPHEDRGVEFKGPGSRTDKDFFVKVIRAVLAMANRRDGGTVIIGVEDGGDRCTPVGLSQADLATWPPDDVLDSLAEYADPSVDVVCRTVVFEDKAFVVLQVREFEDLPVACKRDYGTVLQRGAFYVRSRRKPGSVVVGNQTDMRDLIELATEKRLRQYLELTSGAGASVTLEEPWPTLSKVGGAIIDKIRRRGWWSFIVRPARDRSPRFTSVAAMGEVIRGAAAESRGWRFPRLYNDLQPQRHSDCIEQQSQQGEWIEAWRFHLDGHFMWMGGYPSDWADDAWYRGMPENWRPGSELGVSEVLSPLALAFEFAGRLASQGHLGDHINSAVLFTGLAGRRLTMDLRDRSDFSWARIASTASLPWELEAPTSTFISKVADYPCEIGARLFEMFHWDVDADWCRKIVEQVRSGRG